MECGRDPHEILWSTEKPEAVSLSALIVDDERLARHRLARLLEAHANVLNVVGEAANGDEALAAYGALHPDILFLDIQMPEMDGFEVIRRLPSVPLIVFVTAYDAFALQAFEANAIDYLLKPVEPERLVQAVSKIKQWHREPQGHHETLEQLMIHLQQPTYLRRLQVPVGERIHFLKVEAITHLEADSKYTLVYTTEARYVISATLAELEQQLDPAMFMRIHRSTIINLDFMQELHRYARGKLRVILDDEKGTMLEVGRSYMSRVRAL